MGIKLAIPKLAIVLFVASLAVGIVMLTKRPQVQKAMGVDSPYTFTVAGDWGRGTGAAATLATIPGTGSLFTLSLGDMSYSTSQNTGKEAEWCQLVKSKVGDTYPFELLTGDHENLISEGTLIDNYVTCLPDRMNSVVSPYGEYGREHYFDYQNARFIFLSPNMPSATEPYTYTLDTTHYQWARDRVREAKAAGMWVVVGIHYNCVTLGAKPCAIQSVQDMLIDEGVDLIFNGNEHSYQRTKQLTCAIPGYYRPECIADFDARGGTYVQGKGTTIVIAGTGGQVLYDINPTTDAELPYFAAYSGKNYNPRNGLVKVGVSNAGLSLDFVGSSGGSFTDHFEIAAATEWPVPTPTTTLSAALLADTYVEQANPNTNYGGAAVIKAVSSPLREGLLKFDVQGVGTSQVVKAKLRVYMVDGSAKPGSGIFRRTVDTSWSETGVGGVKWNTAPAAEPAVLGALANPRKDHWYEVDVTSAVTGDGVASFRIGSTSNDEVRFASKESGASQPQLLVTIASGPVSSATATPTPTPTPTPIPSPSPSLEPSPIPSPTPSQIPSVTPTPSSSPVPSELVFAAQSDAGIRSGAPDTNFGALATLEVDDSPDKDFVLKFDVSGIGARQVTEAKIRLYNTDSSTKGGDFYTLNNNWTEAGVTWNNAPVLGSLIYSLGAVAGSTSSPVAYLVDVTGTITQDGTYSYRVVGASTNGANYVAREGLAGQRPELILTVQ